MKTNETLFYYECTLFSNLITNKRTQGFFTTQKLYI